MYICNTQLDEPMNIKLVRLYQQHRLSHMEAADEEQPADFPPYLTHHHHRHKKHRHFAPVSKSKANHKETHVKPLVIAYQDVLKSDPSLLKDTESIVYANYLKNKYDYLFFKEINPPPPKTLYPIA